VGAVAQWLLKSFLKGLLLLAPLAVTFWVFWKVFSWIDGLLGFKVPGLGLLATIAIIIAAGALGSFILVDRLFAWFEAAVGRVPVAKLIYFSLKDFVGAFVGEKKGFNKPVLVSFGESGSIKLLGFATSDSLEAMGIPGTADHIAVYLQQSYNFAGQLVLVPRDRVTPLPGESSRWLTFIVSGGVSGK
jgi:uncharacterized membrane protein